MKMEFHEKAHAFLVARYYFYMTETFGRQGEQVFIHATRYYGEQRGRRMAQRALRDGQALTYETYCRYGEWVTTESVRGMGQENRGYVETFSPDLVRVYTQCPWNQQFFEMGAEQAGRVYCRYLDAAICQGFNPDIPFTVERSLNDGAPCVHRIGNSGIAKEEQLKNDGNHLRTFDYHCAHLFWSFREVCVAVLGKHGLEIADQVLSDFSDTYGAAMAERILQYSGVNFNAAD